MDGSSYKDGHLKSKMDEYKISPQSGRIILQGWPLEVQNGRIQNKVHKMDGSSYEDDNLKWTNPKWVHKVDGSFYKGDESSPKWMDRRVSKE